MVLVVLFFLSCSLTACSNKHETSGERLAKVTVPTSQEGRKAMNFTATRGKIVPCLLSQQLPALLSSHVNVKKCIHTHLSPKEGKKKALTRGQRE